VCNIGIRSVVYDKAILNYQCVVHHKKKKGNKRGQDPIHNYTKEKNKPKETIGVKQQINKQDNIAQKL